MPSAICPYCKETAFSSAGFDREWTCPSCGQDVSRTLSATIRAVPHHHMEEPTETIDSKELVEHYSKFWTTGSKILLSENQPESGHDQ